MGKKSSNIWLLFGFIVGVVLLVIPEPSTSLLGLGIMAYTAFSMGWAGKPEG